MLFSMKTETKSVSRKARRVIIACAVALIVLVVCVANYVAALGSEYHRSMWLKTWALRHEVYYETCFPPGVQSGPTSEFMVPATEIWQIGPWNTIVWHNKDPRLKFFIELDPMTRKIDAPVIGCR
jgi:hypothetical protein